MLRKPFDLTIELANKGACPWIPGVGHKLLLEGDFKSLGLPETVDFKGEWVLPGEKRLMTLKGIAPATAGKGELKVSFVSPFHLFQAVVEKKVQMVWKQAECGMRNQTMERRISNLPGWDKHRRHSWRGETPRYCSTAPLP